MLHSIPSDIHHLSPGSSCKVAASQYIFRSSVLTPTLDDSLIHPSHPIITDKSPLFISKYPDLYLNSGELAGLKISSKTSANDLSISPVTPPSVKSDFTMLIYGYNQQANSQIFIRTLQDSIIVVEIDPNSTINDLKQIIFAKEGIPTNHQRLMYGSRDYSDSSRLSDLSVSQVSLTLLLRLTGGNPEVPQIRPQSSCLHFRYWFGFGRSYQAGRVGVEGRIHHSLSEFQFAWQLPRNWHSDSPLDDWDGVSLLKPEDDQVVAGMNELDLTGLGCQHLPESISAFTTTLVLLSVAYSRMSSLPVSIGSFSRMTHLFVHNNQLTSLPDSIGCLVSLQEFYASSNELLFLPDSIGNLICLVGLYIDDNHLTELPLSISNMSSLSKLVASKNLLGCIPNCIVNMSSLTFLVVSLNPFTATEEEKREVESKFTREGLRIHS